MTKRPTWAKIVGVLGIIFACFGIMGAGYDIMMPKIMELQKEMFSHVEELQKQYAENEDTENMPDEEFFEIFKSMEQMWETPNWFSAWSIIVGILKLGLSGFALFASICLLQTKPSSIKLFYLSASLNIVLVVLKFIVLIASMSFMALAMMFSGFFALVVNIVLIVVVALGNKTAFYQNIPETV